MHRCWVAVAVGDVCERLFFLHVLLVGRVVGVRANITALPSGDLI